MKTKIIYISGNEVFDMAEIRAAFEEVRSALGLDKDTIMFGVPVDKESALDVPVVDAVSVTPEQDMPAVKPMDEVAVAEPVVEKKSRRTAKRVRAEEPAPEIITETEIQNPPALTEEIVEESAEPAPVIPILSVLASKSDAAADAPADEEKVMAPAPIIDEVTSTAPEVSQEAPIDDAPAEQVTAPDQFIDDGQAPVSVVETVTVVEEVIDEESELTVHDMISDNTPATPAEKTLEQLLESMTPLREDIIEEPQAEDIVEEVEEPDDEAPTFTDDNDETLARLADEFAKTQDKLPSANTANRGKIGKLKNIIPFHRSKQNDNSLMSDLFGWAGMAANDDDVSLPSFFANAKK